MVIEFVVLGEHKKYHFRLKSEVVFIMFFRLGYVAMTLNLVDCSPSKTVTFSAYNKLPNDEARLYRLRKITRKNLENTLRILRYNKAYNIKVYRLTSKLVPLATHPETAGWNYVNDFAQEFREIGSFIKENDFRISAHPDHFTLLNSPTEKVLKDSIRDLEYHVKIYEAMGLGDYKYKMVIHVGGQYRNKADALERFKKNFLNLPERIRRRITVENDDKSYTASEVLKLCKELKIPMVIDVHHHNCVNNGENLADLLPKVFSTWNEEYFNPKIHFSSPRSYKDFRSHSDFIEFGEFTEFLKIAKEIGRNFDVMLEVKRKDAALLKLSRELGLVKGIERINEGKFKIE